MNTFSFLFLFSLWFFVDGKGCTYICARTGNKVGININWNSSYASEVEETTTIDIVHGDEAVIAL